MDDGIIGFLHRIRADYVPSASYRFLELPLLPSDALANRILYPIDGIRLLTSSSWVCQLRWRGKKAWRWPSPGFLLCKAEITNFNRVGPTGVEPARPYGHMPLKHARLPIPPRAQSLSKIAFRPSIESTDKWPKVKGADTPVRAFHFLHNGLRPTLQLSEVLAATVVLAANISTRNEAYHTM